MILVIIRILVFRLPVLLLAHGAAVDGLVAGAGVDHGLGSAAGARQQHDPSLGLSYFPPFRLTRFAVALILIRMRLLIIRWNFF